MNVTAFQNAYLQRIDTIEQAEEINLHVANALRFVIQNVFGKFSSAFVLTVSTSGGPVEFWMHDILAKLFATWGLITVQLYVLSSKIKYNHVAGKSYCHMIMIDNFESLQETNIAEINKNSDSLEYYFIFLQIQDRLVEKEMAKIFQYCYDNYWIHCNVMVQNSRGEVLVYTYYPFKESICFQTKPDLINRFIGVSFEKDIIFPDKLHNLQSCPLKLSTWETPPFVMQQRNSKFPNIDASGFEIYIMISISESMNFTLDIEWLSVDTYEMNQSPDTVPLSKLQNHETNFTMGYFRHTSDRDKIATPTYVTYYIPVSAVILRKLMNQKDMGVIAIPFDQNTWFLLFIVYIIIGFMSIFRTKKPSSGILEVFMIIFGIPIMNRPKCTSTRIRLMTTMLSSLILRSIYQSVLFDLFRKNYYKAPPLNLESLVRDGYTAVSTQLTVQFLIYVPQIEDKTLPLISINNTSEMFPLQYLEMYTNESLVAMTVMEFALYYVREELNPKNYLQILPIKIRDQQICLYLPKHSYFSNIVDLYIIRLHQAGLLNKWRAWSNLEYFVVEVKASKAYKSYQVMVNLDQLYSFLLLVVILFLTSILIFIFEILSKKLKWLGMFFEIF